MPEERVFYLKEGRYSVKLTEGHMCTILSTLIEKFEHTNDTENKRELLGVIKQFIALNDLVKNAKETKDVSQVGMPQL